MTNIIAMTQQFFRWFYKSSRKYQITFQRIQLTFIYFFALIVLSYMVKNMMGEFPQVFIRFLPFLDQVLDFELLKILSAPEKTFIFYLVILEFLINRSAFNFSILVKFNILLLFILEMLENLIASTWDLFFSRELDVYAGNGMIIKELTDLFFSIFFVCFLIIYIYCFICAFRGRFPVFPGASRIIIDSVGFWLQIRMKKNTD